MTYTYTLIDGQRVEASTVAPRFREMAAEFQRVFGMSLHVRSGTRTWQQQYDLWYGWSKRLPGYSLALHPDNPNALHVETNPMGSRALDLYDSGSDPGVTRVGTRRNNWIRDNAPRWGFTLSGLTFNPQEGWHIHYTQTISGGAPAGGSSWPARERYGEEWVKAAQTKLNQLGLNAGEVDGKDGPQTQTATKELQGVIGAEQDGIYGPVTDQGANTILGGKNITSRPVADIQKLVGATVDNVWGPLTALAVYKWQKANGLTPDAWWGPASDAKGFAQPEQPPVQVGENRTSRPVKDIQAAVGMPADKQDGQYGPETTKYVIEFQKSWWVEADGIWGMTSDGLAFPPAGSLFGVDYSFARPGAALLSTRHVEFAGRYLWPEKYSDGRTNKGLGRTELDDLASKSIEVFCIYEEDGKELKQGFQKGVEIAKTADSYLASLGLDRRPIYFNVDYDAPAEDMPAILEALKGVASVIGLDRTGLYAGYGPLKAAFDAGVITWGFQAYAWSGGKWDPRAQLQQWSNGQWGDQVDFTRAVAAEYGQNPVALPEPEQPTLNEQIQTKYAELDRVTGELGDLVDQLEV